MKITMTLKIKGTITNTATTESNYCIKWLVADGI
jgi:hypothetical protein